MAGFLALVFMEEIDWGAVYGVPQLAIGLRQVFGNTNMHNALSGASYMLFALPVGAYFLLPFSKRPAAARVIEELGEEHIRTGKPICYTSGDSVFQIAAHETHFSLDRLYDLCALVRRLVDPLNIGRVIARPFVGEARGTFRRTPKPSAAVLGAIARANRLPRA